jgi:hypothetical protein
LLRNLDEGGRQLARLLWPTTTNFPTFYCFYIDTLGSAWPMQMTINKNHVLKNIGALNATEYFDQMLGDSKPDKYSTVFDVPEDMVVIYKAQKISGPFGGTKSKPVNGIDVGARFEQWVMGI